MMRFYGVVLLCLLLGAAVGCVDGSGPEGEGVATQKQGIINGNLDTTRNAVVAIASRNSICSGTIIQTDPQRGLGWVLTAAHCVDDSPQAIVQGSDLEDPDVVYEIVDYVAHPAYDPRNTTYDFAMILFAGASNSTPVIPSITGNDGLGVGDVVTSVGYGRTTPSWQTAGNNTRRYNFSRGLSDLDPTLLVYSLSAGGICSGDSGGPVLATIGGRERVVGVHSSVTDDCEGYGFSGRVSAVYGSWVQGQLNGNVEESCDLCRQVAQSGDGACTGVISDCYDSDACNSLLECFSNCNTDACQRDCADNNRQGLEEYLEIFECICEDACATECAGEDFCPEPASCGFQFSDQTCNDCSEGRCCAEMSDCAEDGTCGDCLSGNASGATCENNSAFNSYASCLSDNCAEECGIEGNSCGFSAEGGCGTCLEGECCAEGDACAGDATCSACLRGESDAETCNNNSRFNNFLGCLGACQGDPCDVNGDGEPDGNNDNPGGNNAGSNNDNPGGNNAGSNNDSAGNNNAGGDEPDANNGGFFDRDNNDSGNNGETPGFTGGGGGSTSSTTCTTAPGGRAPVGGALWWALGALGFAALRRRKNP